MAGSKPFRYRDQSARWAPLWAYVATTVVIISAQVDSDADWRLRLVIAIAAVAANVAIITAIHRRWGFGRSHC
jgi:hypothetical protein